MGAGANEGARARDTGYAPGMDHGGGQSGGRTGTAIPSRVARYRMATRAACGWIETDAVRGAPALRPLSSPFRLLACCAVCFARRKLDSFTSFVRSLQAFAAGLRWTRLV